MEGAYEATDFFPSMGERGKWLHFTAAAIRDPDGHIIGAVETLEDITERKFAEGQLRLAAAALDAAANAILLTIGKEKSSLRQSGLHQVDRLHTR